MTHEADDRDRIDEMTLAAALRDDEACVAEMAHLPPADLVWWRATIRTRAEAALTIERPMIAVQLTTVACLVALAAGAIASTWRSLPDLVVQHALVAMLGVVVGLLVAPIAVLLALTE